VSDPRRQIPSVDRLLESAPFQGLQERYPRDRVVARLRLEVDRVRRLVAEAGGPEEVGDPTPYARAVEEALSADEIPSLRPVVNATGVVLHTNLGRAPLAAAAIDAMVRVAAGYSNLEYDLPSGARGSRYQHCVDLLRELTGAESALVLNNNAAALVLALDTVARDRRVLVSRGELVEIGGSFRIPDILERSGARLREVGSTNRTRISDYRDAIDPDVAAILKVHRSNFRITGFAEEASLDELAVLALERGIPLLHDLGSGLLIDPGRLGLPHEPRPGESLAAGADAVAFSGDKLLGGPQAGLIVGRDALVSRMRRNPLCRAMRVDKVTLAGLEATLRLYRDPERALREVPTLALLSAPIEGLEARARLLSDRLSARGASAEAAPGVSVVGGGTYPDAEIPSWTVRVTAASTGAEELSRRLRLGDPPVVGRVEDGRLVLDLRTVLPAEDETLARALGAALADPGADEPRG